MIGSTSVASDVIRAVMVGSVLGSAPLVAQAPGPENPPRIEDIAQIVAAGEEERIDGPTTSVRVQRGTWQPARRAMPLQFEDAVSLERNYHVKLDVDRPSQDGKLTLATDLRRHGGEVVSVPDFTVGADGEFVLARDPAQPGHYALRVVRGVAVIDWVNGVLAVEAAGHRTVITGTKVVVAVTADGSTAFVFVVSGTLTAAGSAVSAGDLVQLERGVEAPTVSRPSERLVRGLRDVYRYNRAGLWSGFSPWYASPAFLVPAVGVVAGVGTYFVVTGLGEDEASVEVIVRIPLPF